MKNLTIIEIFILLFFVAACDHPEADPQVIIDADIAFSDMSQDEGISKAFLHYADSSAVIFRIKDHPMEGYGAIYESFKDSSPDVTLTWKPEFADIAASGDLGYSWGKYLRIKKDSVGNPVEQRGYYISIWKKQHDGTWKYVFDGGSGNIN